MTEVFEEQPLASPGSANNISIAATVKSFMQLQNSSSVFKLWARRKITVEIQFWGYSTSFNLLTFVTQLVVGHLSIYLFDNDAFPCQIVICKQDSDTTTTTLLTNELSLVQCSLVQWGDVENRPVYFYAGRINLSCMLWLIHEGLLHSF